MTAGHQDCNAVTSQLYAGSAEVCCHFAYCTNMQYILVYPCGVAVAGSRATMFAATDPQAPSLAASTDSHYLDAHAEPAQPSGRAGDRQLASWLWEWSKGQAHLPDDWDVAAA
jgi:hypothetical protein